LITYWFGISVPLVFFGSFIGFKRSTIKNPIGYNIVPKQIKDKPWYIRSKAICFIGGLLPFGSFFVELNFLMTSIW
jgi:transmembrane 9 superfamily protein 2/4